MDDVSANDVRRQPSVAEYREEDAPRRWQFSLSRLFLATIPVALLFAWLGTLKSTTWLHLVLAGILTTGYLAVECLGNHAMPAGVTLIWRASYYAARASAFQAVCLLLCLISFLWEPAPRAQMPPPSSEAQYLANLNQKLRSHEVYRPYVMGTIATSIFAWLTNLAAAYKIRRSRSLLFVTTFLVWSGGYLLNWSIKVPRDLWPRLTETRIESRRDSST